MNDVGVATLVTGVVAPTAGYLFGSLRIDDPLRLLAVASIHVAIGAFAPMRARTMLEGLA